jgi:predicted dehydrogenase
MLAKSHSVLVCGFGSIGQRHVRILREMGQKVHVFSRRKLPEEEYYQNLEAALSEVNPEYVVIANETSEHESTLKKVLSIGVPTILVEKPLFSSSVENILENPKSQVCVAYNLRLHPLLQQLFSEIKEQSIISVQVYVGQYLPDWRPQQDYRKSYSVSRAQGGGVLRDLSHELDYINWFFGPWQALTASGGHYSSLAGDSDDVFCLLLKMERCPVVSLQMNYLDRSGRREIIINTEEHTFHLDLVKQEFKKDQKPTVLFLSEKDETYQTQHTDMLNNNGKFCCSLQEGLDVLRMIDAAEKSTETETWQKNRDLR